MLGVIAILLFLILCALVPGIGWFIGLLVVGVYLIEHEELLYLGIIVITVAAIIAYLVHINKANDVDQNKNKHNDDKDEDKGE